jgi:hypothetical protein
VEGDASGSAGGAARVVFRVRIFRDVARPAPRKNEEKPCVFGENTGGEESGTGDERFARHFLETKH